MDNPLYLYDLEYKNVIGVDEAGRGPLAGPVVAAAVILKQYSEELDEINDSKKLTEKKREKLYDIILNNFNVAVGIASVEEIDKLNTVIKQKLTNALLRNSRRYKPFYEIDSYSIETTPHGNKVFNACWKEKDSFGVGSIIKYETVSMKDFNAVNLSDDRGTLQLMNLLNIR